MNVRSPITLASVVAGLLLGGCGFQPLYADNVGIAPRLSAVAVETPATRTGYLLREELNDELATAEGEAPRYRLVVRLQERRFPRGLRVDDTANRYEQRVTANYRLIDLTTGRVLTSGIRPVSVTYDVSDQPYAGAIAAQDGQERAAGEAARVIRTELARFFAGQPPATQGAAAR